jgi:hypothetical protein
MSPFQIRIVLHYFYSPEEFRNDVGTIAESAIHEVADMGLLEVNSSQEPRWRITDKGRAYVGFLMAVPLPVQTWGMPPK